MSGLVQRFRKFALIVLESSKRTKNRSRIRSKRLLTDPSYRESASSSTSTDSTIMLPIILFDSPLTFENVVRLFKSMLEFIEQNPELSQSVTESEYFKVCLHCTVHRWIMCTNKVDYWTNGLEIERELANLGFSQLPDEDWIRSTEETKESYRIEMTDLNNILEQARHLELPSVEAVESACYHDIAIRKAMVLSETELLAGRWDKVFQLLIHALYNLEKRNKIWPEWNNLDEKRRVITDSVQLLGCNDTIEWSIVVPLLWISYKFSQEHADELCESLEFHSVYLDIELSKMMSLIKTLSTDEVVQKRADLLAANDVEMCKIWLRNMDKCKVEKLNLLLSLRMYRICMQNGALELGNKWMKSRFTEEIDCQNVKELLEQTLKSMKKKKDPSLRIRLNGGNENVGTDYELPLQKEESKESCSPKPWWIEEFRKRLRPAPVLPKQSSVDSLADTKIASSNEMLFVASNQTLQNAKSEMRKNEAAHLFVVNDRMRDYDIYTVQYDAVSLEVENGIPLKWLDCYGREQERKINISVDVAYHCRVLTYHPVKDLWKIDSDFCRVSGKLQVDQPGAVCEPLTGDCGIAWGSQDEHYVFKIHKYPSKHRLRDYLADVRAQTTSQYYVQKFRDLTNDRFGCLQMLHSDCLAVFESSELKTIIELMTRERLIRPGSMVRFDKYTNNASWKNREVNTDLLETFTHFTHDASEGVLMVTDLQGWVGRGRGLDQILYILTDPVIHCPKRPIRFGNTNQEEEGIRLFYEKVHPECNHICRELKLKRPDESLIGTT